jgi:hypothetical protein
MRFFETCAYGGVAVAGWQWLLSVCNGGSVAVISVFEWHSGSGVAVGVVESFEWMELGQY